MTTLRERIAAKFHATWDLDEHDVDTFVAELLAMWRDEAPPSDDGRGGDTAARLGALLREGWNSKRHSHGGATLWRQVALVAIEYFSRPGPRPTDAELAEIAARTARSVHDSPTSIRFVRDEKLERRALYDLGHARGYAKAEAEHYDVRKALIGWADELRESPVGRDIARELEARVPMLKLGAR